MACALYLEEEIILKTAHRTKRTTVSQPLRMLLSCALVACLSLGLACTGTGANDDSADGPSDDTGIVDQLVQEERSAIAGLEIAGDADQLFFGSVYQGNISDASAAVDMSGLPSTHDLRDNGVVPLVRNQAPWGTCWSFGATAASEISIMSEVGLTDPSEEFDLSELHLAWFSYTPLPDDAGSQAGEGVHTLSTDSPGVLDQGGHPFTATSVFSSGVGPINDIDVPYRNREGITIDDSEGTPIFYSSEGDWSVDESLRFVQTFELEESSVLPSPAARDLKNEYLYNAAGTKAIKEELLEGRGVVVCFCADTSYPGQDDPSQYINLDTWAHYTFDEGAGANHAVCIVGWDDDYPASNFIEGQEPPGDGAWIVRNSWGSVDSEFPDYTSDGWGVDGGGYFYLSYYDMSLSSIESFDYYTERYGNEISDYYVIDQYDYMPANSVSSILLSEPASMANVFEATEDQSVRSLSCETARPNTTATYQLYLLDEDYATPEDGTLLATATETYAFGGYHRIQLDGGFSIEQGQYYSVVVTLEVGNKYEVIVDRSLNETGMNYINAFGRDEDENGEGAAEEDEELTSYAVGIINEGESFLFASGVWQDWAEIITAVKASGDQTSHGAIFDYDNFAIKAYSDPAGSVQQ